MSPYNSLRFDLYVIKQAKNLYLKTDIKTVISSLEAPENLNSLQKLTFLELVSDLKNI
jgi:hypothetical protein